MLEILVGAEAGFLPDTCTNEDLLSVGDPGSLTFYRKSATGFDIGCLDADHFGLTTICSDIAFGDVGLAADGAGLLLLTPRQELAESDGLRLYYSPSPDSQAILMGIGKDELGDRIKLRNLASEESWTITNSIDEGVITGWFPK